MLLITMSVDLSYAQNNLVNTQYGSAIQTYLDQNKESLNLVSSDLADLCVNNEYFSKKTKITHVYVNQRFQGTRIFNAISSVAIKDNVVFYYANNFIGNIADRINTTNPQLSAEQAIQRAATSLNLGSVQNLSLLESSGKKYLFTNGGISNVEIPVELVYQYKNGELILAWDLSINKIGSAEWPSVRVDANTGEIIDEHNWNVSCNFIEDNHTGHNHNSEIINNLETETNFILFKNNYSLVDGSQYNVFELPLGGPNEGTVGLITEPANLDASPFGWHDTDGNVGAEYTITRGNNVLVREDQNGNDGAGYSPDGTSTLNFNFTLDLNQNPLGYEDASLTNLFYMNNMMHDIFYNYGFDEVSGNFQSNNYGNGGSQGDFVLADGQDGGGINNANFSTPPDGGNGYMQMYLWDATGPPGTPLTINTGSVSGDYQALPAQFGGVLTSTPIVSDLVLLIDNNRGGETSTDPNDACNNITNASEINGNIAVIRRGTCEFGFKALAAESAGAVAVLIVNNEATPPFISMGGGAVGDNVTIPALNVTQADGEAIIAALEGGETLNASLSDAGPYQLDGSLDNLIVAHEYGHGISNRLTGGPSAAGCLQNPTQMGEGWSDWFGMVITIKPGDLPEDPRGMATYSVGQEPDGNGIRTFPYTTNVAINPSTYGDTNNAAFTQPHGIGSIWATMLWDLTWAYIDKYGFDEDIFNGTGGNNKAMQVIMDGMKLQPCSPGFVDGRDAILAADIALTGGEDQCMIWEVFTARGLGYFAAQGTQSRSDQSESFAMPPETDPSLANCTSLSVKEFNQNDYKVYPNPTNGNVFIKTNRNLGEVKITLTDLNGRQVYSTQTELFDKVEVNMSQLQSGIYILNINGQSINSNNKIIKN